MNPSANDTELASKSAAVVKIDFILSPLCVVDGGVIVQVLKNIEYIIDNLIFIECIIKKWKVLPLNSQFCANVSHLKIFPGHPSMWASVSLKFHE